MSEFCFISSFLDFWHPKRFRLGWNFLLLIFISVFIIFFTQSILSICTLTVASSFIYFFTLLCSDSALIFAMHFIPFLLLLFLNNFNSKVILSFQSNLIVSLLIWWRHSKIDFLDILWILLLESWQLERDLLSNWSFFNQFYYLWHGIRRFL